MSHELFLRYSFLGVTLFNAVTIAKVYVLRNREYNGFSRILKIISHPNTFFCNRTLRDVELHTTVQYYLLTCCFATFSPYLFLHYMISQDDLFAFVGCDNHFEITRHAITVMDAIARVSHSISYGHTG